MVTCKACSGTYEPIGADGIRYFHTCPPLTVVTVEREGAAVTVSLIDLLDSDLRTVRRDGKSQKVAKPDLLPGDVIEGYAQIARPGHRDENIKIGANGKAVAKDEGLGVVTSGVDPVTKE